MELGSERGGEKRNKGGKREREREELWKGNVKLEVITAAHVGWKESR